MLDAACIDSTALDPVAAKIPPTVATSSNGPQLANTASAAATAPTPTSTERTAARLMRAEAAASSQESADPMSRATS